MTFARPLAASKHCRHYDYDDGPKCACDLDMSSPQSHLPCMPEWQQTGKTCDWREEFTDEERAAWQAWRDERAARMIVVMAQLPGSSRDTKNKPEWGKSGEFDCTACGTGKVRWSRARSNGHVHAACTTPGCFGIIE